MRDCSDRIGCCVPPVACGASVVQGRWSVSIVRVGRVFVISCLNVRYNVRCCGSTFGGMLSGPLPGRGVGVLSGCPRSGTASFFLGFCSIGGLVKIVFLMCGCVGLCVGILSGGGTYFVCLACKGDVSVPFL